MKNEGCRHMSVPAGRRKQSKFEASHQFFKLRAAVTELMLLDFGFSEKKYLEHMEKYRKDHASADNVDEVVERYKKKLDSFNRWFIDSECDAILNLIREIGTEFTIANSIYPSYTPAREDEIRERRIHLDIAIAKCYALKQEINYVIGVLPVDMNKYERFDELINHQIALFRGVREADKRFIKNAPSTKPEGYGVNKNKKSAKTSHVQGDSMQTRSAPADLSTISTYQQLMSDQDQLIQRRRVPNTSKLNTSSFPVYQSSHQSQMQQASSVVIGEIKPVLPGQAPPSYK